MSTYRKGKGTAFGHTLTLEQREEIVRRYIAGEEKNALAEEYGITRQAVHSYLRVRSIPIRVKPVIPVRPPRIPPLGPDFGITETVLAYLAGFIDGEGSIGITRCDYRRNKAYYIFISCANTDEAVIRWMHSFLHGCVRINWRPPSSTWQTLFHWNTTGRRAAEVIRLLLPYLRVKYDQAILTLEFHDHVIAYGGHRHNPVTEEELAWRMERHAFVSSLNTRRKL